MERDYFVSVAVATYNGEKFIVEQLNSILKQLNNNDEVIISDDGSTDNTINIINSFKDDRIKIIDGPRKGVKQNFANAIKHCKGKYIFLSDQDDIWLDGKVDKVLTTFKETNCLCVIHDSIVFDSDSKEIMYDSFFKFRKSKRGIIKNILKNSYIGCCMAFDSSMKKNILPIPNDIEMHDQWIGVICEKYGKSIFVKDKLLMYRRHQDNVSEMKHSSVRKMIRNRIVFIKKFLLKGKNLQHYIFALYYRVRIILYEIIYCFSYRRLKSDFIIKKIGDGINFVSGGKVFLICKGDKKYILKGFDIFNLYVNEAKIMTSFNSAFIPKIISQEDKYFIEEYFDGIPLKDFLDGYNNNNNNNNNNNDTMRKIIEGFNLCLDDLYMNNIVHRDIRPENIILNFTSNKVKIKLIDFGCAINVRDDIFKFPARIENYLGGKYVERDYYWDDALAFYNILWQYNVSKDVFPKEFEELESKIGRISYERRF